MKAGMHHVEYVAAHIRRADANEIWALGEEPRKALIDSYKESVMAWAIMYGREAAAVFGLSAESFVSETAIPWMVTTGAVDKNPIGFLRICRRNFGLMTGFPHLVNYVDDRHEASKRWLEWLGFRLDEPKPLGPHGILFRKFEMGGA